MRKTALFIISAFVFGACAPKASVKEFEDFVDVYKQVQEKNNAEAMDHVRLTKEAQDDIKVLKKQLGQMEMKIFQLRMVDDMTMRQFGQMYQSLIVILKALEYKGIKLDLKKVWERMQREEIEKKLKEKSK